MILIGENIHIISKSVRSALENKDQNFAENLIKIMQNCDAVDLNVGPAKGKLDMVFNWLVPLIKHNNISFDSSNIDAIESGLKLVSNPENCFINSTNADDDKLERLTDLAKKYNCNLIALGMSKETGIPKDADGRMELIFKIYEKCMEKGIVSCKIFFDPLILPLNVEQSQAKEVVSTILMIKESFEPKVNTVVGLSNISNGMPSDLRRLVNRTFAVMLFGAGLDGAIIDAKDEELIRIMRMLECNNPQNDVDKLYTNIANMVQCFGDVDDIGYNKNNSEHSNIIKTVRILTGKEIFSNSYTQL
ncbi:dihydropteroate synthase [bacterium]|nr:dihydropteroate synthase [bacterium]